MYSYNIGLFRKVSVEFQLFKTIYSKKYYQKFVVAFVRNAENLKKCPFRSIFS